MGTGQEVGLAARVGADWDLARGKISARAGKCVEDVWRVASSSVDAGRRRHVLLYPALADNELHGFWLVEELRGRGQMGSGGIHMQGIRTHRLANWWGVTAPCLALPRSFAADFGANAIVEAEEPQGRGQPGQGEGAIARTETLAIHTHTHLGLRLGLRRFLFSA